MATTKHKSNVVIGSGRLYIDLLDDGSYSGERFLGDSQAASLSVTTERTTVFSGDGPIAEKLADVVRSITRTLTLTLRDMSAENLALFVAGEASTRTQNAVAVTDELLTVSPGRWYQLGAAKDKPGGVAEIDPAAAKTTVKNKAGTTTYDAGEDYETDPETGRLYIVPGRDIADGSEIKVSYTPVASSREGVATGKPQQIMAAVRYVEDPARGEGRNFYARLCSVGASGEMALKGRDTEQQIQLTAEIQEPDDDWPALSIDGVAA